jgi:hypothetical protein
MPQLDSPTPVEDTFLSFTQVLHEKKTGYVVDTPLVDDVFVLSGDKGVGNVVFFLYMLTKYFQIPSNILNAEKQNKFQIKI